MNLKPPIMFQMIYHVIHHFYFTKLYYMKIYDKINHFRVDVIIKHYTREIDENAKSHVALFGFHWKIMEK